MKKLLLLLVALGAAAGWVRGTPAYSYHRLRGALEAGEVATVEEHLDLSVFTALALEVVASSGAAVAKEAGASALGSALVGALAEAFAPALTGVLAPFTTDALKKRIAAKEFATRAGDFVYGSTVAGMAGLQRLDQTALLDVSGSCGGKDATLRLVMEKRPGPLGTLVPNWRVSGVDKASVPAFVEVCVKPALARAAAQ